jgi:hypothetical protein
VSVVHQDRVLGQVPVPVEWTYDLALSTAINRKVAHHNGQWELAEEIRRGMEAREAGDLVTATSRLGRALRLATDLDRPETALRLSKVVEVKEGTSRLINRAENPSLDEDYERAKLETSQTSRLR